MKKETKFEIIFDKQNFSWNDQFITGAQLKALGGIDPDDEVYLEKHGSQEDELIPDEAVVDLSQPGAEHFFSRKAEKEVVLIVNGSPKKWNKKKIKFEEVIILAYGTYIDKPTMVYTVAYEDGPKQNPEGSMTKGTVVFVQNKMIFHATATDKS